MEDVVIRNGTVVDSGGTFLGDVRMSGERITELGRSLRGGTEIDATGCYVLPGAIDPHVHLQMWVGDYRSSDDFRSGTVAAACGGTTTVIDFVEPTEGEPFLAALAGRRAEADELVAVDYGLHMTIPAWHASHAEVLSGLPEVVAAGVPSFKLYLAYEGLRLNDVLLHAALRVVGSAGGLPIVHCENGPLCEALRAEAVASGAIAPSYHAATRPVRQEAEAVSRAMDIAELAGSRLYIVHVSCAEAAERVETARSRGEPVFGETCPQYLALGEEALDGPQGERFVCAPPLRSEADQSALWNALARGSLDVLATDHCPFTAEEKAGHADFTTIPGGLPSIEVRLSLAYTLGVLGGILSLERWVEVCCTAAARIFGLSRKGRLVPGYDADLVVFDPQAEVIVAADALHEAVDWTPYQGIRLAGWPRHVFSRGRAVVRNGDYVGQDGWGRFVARETGVS
jgi:dihydropyrimidinase